MARPICVCCGKPYGQRATHTENVKWPLGEEMPPYRGNGIVVKVTEPYRTASQSTLRNVTMMSTNSHLRDLQERQLAKEPEESVMTASRYIWDGETYHGGFDPFCTLRCALDYAREAYAERKASGRLRAV